MVDIRTLGILLDTLQDGNELPGAPRPTAAVVRAPTTGRIAGDDARALSPAAGSGACSVIEGVLLRPAGAAHQGEGAAVAPEEAIPADESAPVFRNFSAQTSGTSLELSATAQWLQQSVLPDSADNTAASIRASAPLLTSQPGDVLALAQALRESIAQSGLFYESHLADWALQRYPEAELRREPQAAWDRLVMLDPSSPPRGGAEVDATGPAAGTSVDVSRVNVDLLRAQLQALESRQFSWRGELWPGQTGAVTVAEDGAAASGDLPGAWRTQLTLTLPELGRVDVDMRLVGLTLQLALTAAPDSVPLLSSARAALIAAFEARAQPVASIVIRAA